MNAEENTFELIIKSANTVDLGELCRTDKRFNSGIAEVRLLQYEVADQTIKTQEARQACWEPIPTTK